MTPKEKAEHLISKYTILDIEIGGQFDGYLTMKIGDAKDCSLIVVDEILNAYEFGGACSTQDLNYWNEVKAELEKL